MGVVDNDGGLAVADLLQPARNGLEGREALGDPLQIEARRQAESRRGQVIGGVVATHQGRGDLRFIFRPLSLEALKLAETTARIDALRERLRGKHVLAVIDGVLDERDEEKIQPLLSALSNCAILVTSRTTQISPFRSATLSISRA